MPSRQHLLVADLAAVSKNWSLTPEGERRLREEAPPGWDIHVVRAPTSSDGDGPKQPSDEVMTAMRDAEVYFGFGMPRPLFVAAPHLRWAHSAAAGVGSALFPEMLESDVILTNSAGIHAIPIAEFIVGGILYFLRGMDFMIEQQRRSEWSKARFVRMDSVLREVEGLRVLVVGVGGIGGATATRLSALGATCIGIRRRVGLGPPPGFDRIVGMDELEAELPKTDVVVLAAPLTGETSGVLTADRLDLLPKSAIVVNVARGALVDEDALAERLASGRLRAAVLDVFREEPLAATSPFWSMSQVIVSPHVSPVSPGKFWPRQLDLFLDNWRRYSKGEPLRNVVDKRAGY